MKRYRMPTARPRQIKVQWGKETHDEPCLVGAWGEGAHKGDVNMLFMALSHDRYDFFGKKMLSIVEELEARGYDITTLKFSIQKKILSENI